MNPGGAVLVCRCKTSLFYQLVTTEKARIISEALRRHNGNRTHTAKALGLQRTYLIRLIRTLRLK